MELAVILFSFFPQITKDGNGVQQHVQKIKLFYKNEYAAWATFRATRLFYGDVNLWMNGYVSKLTCRIWGDTNSHDIHESSIHPERVNAGCGV